MGVVAVIPARGGSKGLPGKNLARVGGVSLVARAVAAGLAAASIDRVVVSTDDATIAEEARRAGAEVVVRPDDLAGDTATSESALLHVLDALGSPTAASSLPSTDASRTDASQPDILVFIQATSPFIDPIDLDFAVSRVRDGHCDVAFAAVESHVFLWRAEAEGAVGVNHDSSFRPRRQDRHTEYAETGAFYVMRADGFRAAGFRFFGRIEVALVDPQRAIEIDDATELEIARRIAPLVDRPCPIDVDALVTDFDGVHTDDRVSIGGDGIERVTASRSDGAGIEMLRRAGYPLLILSRETNRVVAARGRKLHMDVRQGLEDKATVLVAWAKTRGIPLDRIAYVGNDLNDLECMALVGWPIAVADAHPEVLAAARIVLAATGGHGAIREVSERILRSDSPRRSEEEQWQSPLADLR